MALILSGAFLSSVGFRQMAGNYTLLDHGIQWIVPNSYDAKSGGNLPATYCLENEKHTIHERILWSGNGQRGGYWAFDISD